MKKLLKKENLKFILAGALTGAVNGFFGGGGGIVSVAILKNADLKQKRHTPLQLLVYCRFVSLVERCIF